MVCASREGPPGTTGTKQAPHTRCLREAPGKRRKREWAEGAPARDLLHNLGYMGGVPQGSENARFERQYGPPCTDTDARMII